MHWDRPEIDSSAGWRLNKQAIFDQVQQQDIQSSRQADVTGVWILGKKLEYSPLNVTVPTVDNPEVDLVLPQRLAVDLSRSGALKSVAVGAQNDKLSNLCSLTSAQSSMCSMTSGATARQVGMAQRCPVYEQGAF